MTKIRKTELNEVLRRLLAKGKIRRVVVNGKVRNIANEFPPSEDEQPIN
jgi:hypothetical protein